MGRFILGVVVGVFLGVLIVAPNPLLSTQVRGLWAETRVWLAAVLVTAQEVAERADDLDEGVHQPKLRPSEAKGAQ